MAKVKSRTQIDVVPPRKGRLAHDELGNVLCLITSVDVNEVYAVAIESNPRGGVAAGDQLKLHQRAGYTVLPISYIVELEQD